MAKDGWDKFEQDFRKMQPAWKQEIHAFLRSMALRWLAKTKQYTPVESGKLRAGWQVSDVVKNGGTLEITLYNTVEYAPYVEEGHKIVAGGRTVGFKEGCHMVAISLSELEEAMPKSYGAMFHKFISQLDG
jgi:hypothetical protein